ncbi:MAG: hypothetical protein M3325_12785, partial [Actinomycetota bacterium]|nr:hypothetical protein [Actinomycetota bacterium]
MNTPTFPRKLFRRRPRRAADSRRRTRGSVLILVVALLVLMALIGTAWISSSRNDRTTAIQHASNTEIEMLTDGVINMA